MVTLHDKLEPLMGAKSAKALAGSLDIHTVQDLLRHYPRRYDERGQLTDIAGLELGEHVTVLARVVEAKQRPVRNRRNTYLTQVVITDGYRRLECAFFGGKWQTGGLSPGKSALFSGKVSVFNKKLQLTNPDYHLIDGDIGDDTGDEAIDDFIGLIPVYPATAKLQSWQIAKCVRQALEMVDDIDDPMPAELLAKRKLANYGDVIQTSKQ